MRTLAKNGYVALNAFKIKGLGNSCCKKVDKSKFL